MYEAIKTRKTNFRESKATMLIIHTESCPAVEHKRPNDEYNKRVEGHKPPLNMPPK